MKNIQKHVTYLIIIILLIIAIGIFVFSQLDEKNHLALKDYLLMLINVVVSLTIAFLINYFNVIFIEQPERERQIKSLFEKIYLISDASDQGIVSIKEKDKYQVEFWKNLILETNEQLDLLAHTLDTWIGNDYGITFRESILRILKNEKSSVRILILNPDHDSVNAKLPSVHDLKTRVSRVVNFFQKEIIPKLDGKQLERLHIHYLDEFPQTYMYICTDKYVIISPYLVTLKRERNFIVQLYKDSKCASNYIDDFNNLFEAKYSTAVKFNNNLTSPINVDKNKEISNHKESKNDTKTV